MAIVPNEKQLASKQLGDRLAYREFDEAQGSRPAGYEDVNDAERLCVDPAVRHVVGGQASQPEDQAASTRATGENR